MSSVAVGTVLQNRYRISKVLYQSRLTNVYLVDDIHLRGNVWAVKEMKFLAMDSFERQNIIKQFELEVRRMTELSHPNFAKVIDFFVEGQNLYILRQFIPAYDISTIMKKTSGYLRERDVMKWGIQLADVLNYLYNRKFPAVFFRELNLSNILVKSDGKVSLIDLGLATAFLTETDPDKLSVMGATNYASPEQFEENGQFDQRSLVYNLGALLYHILTKKNPAHSLFNLPPIEQLNPEVSGGTRMIIKKATEIDPRLRYQTLAEIVKDMQSAVKGIDSSGPEPVREVKFDAEMHLEPEREKKPIKLNWNYMAIIIILSLTAGILYLIYKIFF